MSDFASALDLSASGLRAQATRLRHLSENIANADTPGYRRKSVAFVVDRNESHKGVSVGPVRLSQQPLQRVFEPSHPLADTTGHFDGSNVDLLIEITDAREAQRSYEANLKLFDQTQQMSSSLLELLRK